MTVTIGESRALVTGASSGIGRALAIRLARNGAQLVITARSGAQLEALADDIARDHATRPVVVPADLSRAARAAWERGERDPARLHEIAIAAESEHRASPARRRRSAPLTARPRADN
jgi:short-subunit dehydrogenase